MQSSKIVAVLIFCVACQQISNSFHHINTTEHKPNSWHVTCNRQLKQSLGGSTSAARESYQLKLKIHKGQLNATRFNFYRSVSVPFLLYVHKDLPSLTMLRNSEFSIQLNILYKKIDLPNNQHIIFNINILHS